jgi:hypothetical protein
VLKKSSLSVFDSLKLKNVRNDNQRTLLIEIAPQYNCKFIKNKVLKGRGEFGKIVVQTAGNGQKTVNMGENNGKLFIICKLFVKRSAI